MMIYPDVVTECLGKYEELMLPMSKKDREEEAAALEARNAEAMTYRRKNPSKFPKVTIPSGDHNELYWNKVRADRAATCENCTPSLIGTPVAGGAAQGRGASRGEEAYSVV